MSVALNLEVTPSKSSVGVMATGLLPTHGVNHGEKKDSSTLPLVNVELTTLLMDVLQDFEILEKFLKAFHYFSKI